MKRPSEGDKDTGIVDRRNKLFGGDRDTGLLEKGQTGLRECPELSVTSQCELCELQELRGVRVDAACTL